MNVLVSTDDGYVFQTCVMLKSLFAIHTRLSEPIEVYVLLRDVDEKDKKWVETFVLRCGHKPHMIEICDEDYAQISADKYFDNIKNTHHLTMAAYNRLLVTIKLPEYVDKVLYLDSDIIVNKPLYDLYDQLKSEAAIVIEGFTFKDRDYILLANNNIDKTEEIIKHAKAFREKIGIRNDSTYFNSGVMVLNLEWLRKNDFVNMVKQYILEHECTEDADQSILNMILEKRVSYAPMVYNCRPSDFARNNKMFLKNQACILHYGIKPWNNYRTLMGMEWWKFAFMTNFRKTLVLFVKSNIYSIAHFLKALIVS